MYNPKFIHDDELPGIGIVEVRVNWFHIDGINHNGIKRFVA